MIDIPKLIEYLREKLPAFKVGGAAEFQAMEDDSRLMVEGSKTVPTLFVMFNGFRADPNVSTTNEPDQTYTESILIVSCVDNTSDRTGQHGQELVLSTRMALLQVLYNENRFDTDSFPMEYGGDDMFKMDRARYWHKFEFRIRGRITVYDGITFSLDNFNRFVGDFYDLTHETVENPVTGVDIQGLYDNPA